eukprot:TRINITY_DN83_c0_g1_i1.p1 TRINITY_DN83_c0_g1~~TRINITY_DN83_c0_g1_i1.p1  ORF type:complete len:410 (+),score=89.23 TRINITY_DN83_c0_g1_i1:145-1374(+)
MAFKVGSSSRNPVCALVCGRTGSGKSHLIQPYFEGEDGPEVNAGNQSVTYKTTGYPCTIEGKEVCLYDTPGGYDSKGRDQEFIDSMIAAMQRHATGIHKVFFCVNTLACRFDETDRKLLTVMVAMLGGPTNIPKGTFYMCLTRWDRASKEEKKDAQVYKDDVAQFLPGLAFEVVPCGDGNRKEFQRSLLDIGMDRVSGDEVSIQTANMVMVQTLQSEMLEAKKEAENMKEKVLEVEASKRKVEEGATIEKNRLIAKHLQEKEEQKKILEQKEKDFAKKREEDEKKLHQEVAKAKSEAERKALQDRFAEAAKRADAQRGYDKLISKLEGDVSDLKAELEEVRCDAYPSYRRPLRDVLRVHRRHVTCCSCHSSLDAYSDNIFVCLDCDSGLYDLCGSCYGARKDSHQYATY